MSGLSQNIYEDINCFFKLLYLGYMKQDKQRKNIKFGRTVIEKTLSNKIRTRIIKPNFLSNFLQLQYRASKKFKSPSQGQSESSRQDNSKQKDTCYPFDLCYSKCRFSTDRIKQGDLMLNVYYLQNEVLPLQQYKQD